MNRGDHRERIFDDDHDRQQFLDTLGEVCANTIDYAIEMPFQEETNC